MNKFEILVNNGKLYSEAFIKTFGINSPHWFPSNWHQRELSLRHDMVCVLLCNLEEVDVKLIEDERTTTTSERARKRPRIGNSSDDEIGSEDLDYEPLSESDSEGHLGALIIT
jgi:hypothetical protein